jgi:hypothetical protein
MMRHTKVTLVLASLLAVSSVFLQVKQTTAGDYYNNGYVGSSGYAYRDGYWYKGDAAYERYQVQEPYYYYNCGIRYTGYRWVYNYRPVAVNKVVITKEDLSYNNTSEDGWRGRLLDIAKQRDVYEGRARASALEHNEFLESVKVMGLEGNFRWNGYGYEMSYAQNPYGDGVYAKHKQVYSHYPAAQGSTIYGYTELADIYANVDLGEIYNSVLRLREQSYGYEAKATSETHALVGELGSQMAQVKEIEAKGRAAAATLKASEAKDRTTLLKEFWAAYPNGSGAAALPRPDVQQLPANEHGAALGRLIESKCILCHSSEKKNGGLDLGDPGLLTPAQVDKILDRIVHSDPTKRMPLGTDLGPGAPLSKAEIAVFYAAAYGSAGR